MTSSPAGSQERVVRPGHRRTAVLIAGAILALAPREGAAQAADDAAALEEVRPAAEAAQRAAEQSHAQLDAARAELERAEAAAGEAEQALTRARQAEAAAAQKPEARGTEAAERSPDATDEGACPCFNTAVIDAATITQITNSTLTTCVGLDEVGSPPVPEPGQFSGIVELEVRNRPSMYFGVHFNGMQDREPFPECEARVRNANGEFGLSKSLTLPQYLQCAEDIKDSFAARFLCTAD